ncbi:UNVERIFIED_CONTAM: hypothetical protein PYX00_001348 [Menopon gallinae]|uniref:Uncharacterized protein n=1 Tax=Menopon gallinae TaxID=328185 RepID=A0AAW2IDK9_9NEOP
MPSMAASHGGILYYVVKVPKDGEQGRTDSGWDNPFRPDGDLSREADEIVELIREGKPIVSSPGNGTLPAADDRDGAAVATKQSALSASPQKGSNGAANCGDKSGVVDVQRSVVSPQNGGEAEAVVIKKKPKCKCCVIQ